MQGVDEAPGTPDTMELRKKRRRNLVRDVPTRSHYQPHYLERVWYARVKGTTCWQLPLQQEGSTVPWGWLGRERGRGRAVMKQQQWLRPAPSWSARSPGVEDASRPAVPPRAQLVGTRGALQRARTQRLHLRGCSGSSLSRHLLGLAAWRGRCRAGHRSRSWAAPVCVCPEEPAPDPAGDGLHTGSPSLPPWLSDVQSS